MRIGTEEGDGAGRRFPVTAFFSAFVIAIYAAQLVLQIQLYGEIPEMRGLFDFLAPSLRAHVLFCGLPTDPAAGFLPYLESSILANFSHSGGALHLGMNLSGFALLGRRVEAHLGSAFALLLVLVGCLSLACAPLMQEGWHLGFSGVVCAFLGATLLHARATSDRYFTDYALHWAITMAIWSLLPVVSWAGHLAGFVLGAIATSLWLALPRFIRRSGIARRSIAALAATTLLGCGLVQAREALPAVRYRKFSRFDELLERIDGDLRYGEPDRAWAEAVLIDLDAIGALPSPWQEFESAIARSASAMSSADRTQAERREIGAELRRAIAPWGALRETYAHPLFVVLRVDRELVPRSFS